MSTLVSAIEGSLKSILSIFSTIIILFNLFSGLVGCIWLLFLGQWIVILIGFLSSITMPWWWCIVSLPTLALAPILVFFNKRKNKAGIACTTFLVDLYNSVLMTGWIGVVFLWCITLISENKISIIPMFLFAYSVATSPFLYLASKEPKDCYATNLSILVIVLGSFLTVVLFFIGLPLIYPISILCFLMLIKTIGVTIISVLISSEIEQSS